MTPDDELVERAEAALAAALAVEPSPGFKAAVRRRTALAGPARRVPLGWLALATACAGALAVLLLLPQRPAVRSAAGKPASPAVTVARAAAPETAPGASPMRAAAARPPAAPAPRREPSVLVPAGEAGRIQAYYEAMSRVKAAAPRVAADDLAIAPIEIEPLPGPEDGAGPAPGHSRGL